jgi:cation transporter-like permease
MWDSRKHLTWREEEIAALAALPPHLVERLANVSSEISARLSEGE